MSEMAPSGPTPHRSSPVAEESTLLTPDLLRKMELTADRLLESLDVKKGDELLLHFDHADEAIVTIAMEKALQRGAMVTTYERDYTHIARAIQSMDTEEIVDYVRPLRQAVDEADKILLIRAPRDPLALNAVDPDRRALYTKLAAEAHHRRVEGAVPWLLIVWPTEHEAAQENLPLKEYMHEFLNACDQPWAEISAAHERLIGVLDAAKTLELVANEHDPDPRRRTHLKMSIEGMTFCNSTVLRNYPGSEVFSAPVMNSVEGQLFVAGNDIYESVLMRDIHMRVENGRIVEAYAEEGNDELQRILDHGIGARYFGEVALGTNRGLTRRFFNPLLREKVAGSFHITPGHCYEMTSYAGRPVNVNNGNTSERTEVHWDMPVMMHQRYGGRRVVVDGQVIQEDGHFIDPALSVLNPAD